MNGQQTIYRLFRDHKEVLQFSILNYGSRINTEIIQGIIKIRLFGNKISFVGKLYDDPRVTVMLADIKSVEIKFNDIGQISKIYVQASADSVSYAHSPGPDL